MEKRAWANVIIEQQMLTPAYQVGLNVCFLWSISFILIGIRVENVGEDELAVTSAQVVFSGGDYIVCTFSGDSLNNYSLTSNECHPVV